MNIELEESLCEGLNIDRIYGDPYLLFHFADNFIEEIEPILNKSNKPLLMIFKPKNAHALTEQILIAGVLEGDEKFVYMDYLYNVPYGFSSKFSSLRDVTVDPEAMLNDFIKELLPYDNLLSVPKAKPTLH